MDVNEIEAMWRDWAYLPSQYYEADFPELGVKLQWQGTLPEIVDTPKGRIPLDVFKRLAGTRLWERTSTGWVLSD